MSKEYIGNCIDNPLNTINTLTAIIDNANSITKQNFLNKCQVDANLIRDILKYPYDYEFFKNGNIYFYTHSCIEYFYQ